MFDHSIGPYRHRRRRASPDDSERLVYINSLVDDLLELERKTLKLKRKTTVRASRAEAADGKDFAAFKALRSAGRLVEELAGWAIDHQIGLALSELKFVPRQPSGTRDHPDYLRNKATADLHEHEAQGSAYFELDSPTERNAQAERRMLANLLQMNPGGFPSALARCAVKALTALDSGETQDVLRPEKTSLDRNAYTRHQLELQALMHVEYFVAREMKKIAAQAKVGNAYGRKKDTIRGWETRLPKTLGALEVLRALSFAHNAGRNAEAAKSDPSSGRDLEWFEAWYGESALEENGKQYRAAVDGTRS